MSTQNPGSTQRQLYSGGLAETVSRPSPLTYSFLAHWFCGKRSLGKAMQLLGLPYQPISEPLVVMEANELYVDLAVEEATLYKQTLFKYKAQKQLHALPELTIAYERLFSPTCIGNTLKIVLYQSQLISDPTKSVTKAKAYVARMPSKSNGKSIRDIDAILTDEIWPFVIAIGALSEFYSRLIEQSIPDQREYSTVLSYIGSHVSANDWFFTSLSHQAKVRNGTMSYDEYLEHYGIRARKDYELSCLRWYEEKDEIYSHIQDGTEAKEKQTSPEIVHDKKVMSYITAVIHLQLLRSEARRIALIWVDALRQEIIAKVGNDIAAYTREELLEGKIVQKSAVEKASPVGSTRSHETSGKGMPVSPGVISGKAHLIDSSFDTITPGTIGIFPNASTDFTMLYPKCAGIIFLAGGQTSHGAIVAREFGVPALVDGNATGLSEALGIELNGKEGTWRVL